MPGEGPTVQVPQPSDDTWTVGKTPRQEGKPSVEEQKDETRDPGEVPSRGWRERFGLPMGGGSGPPPGGEGEVPQMMKVMTKRLMKKKGMKRMKILSP